MSRPRATDDFVAIRARLEELRRERERLRQEPEREPVDVSAASCLRSDERLLLLGTQIGTQCNSQGMT